MLDTLFRQQTDNTFIQLLRYSIVGGTAFIVDFLALYFLTEYAHIYYLSSAMLAFILGLFANYFLSIKWVFNKRTLSNKWLELGTFALIGAAGLGLNQLFIWAFTELLHFHYLFSKIITAVFVYLWNFSARKYILFK